MVNNTEETEDLKTIIKTGTGIVRLFKESGITKVFGIPDGHTLAFYDGIYQTEGIDHILVNDERTAAFAADAYARVTGSFGVCDAGAAGAMNFPVGLSEAQGYGSPVIALAGVVKTEDTLKNIPHDINVLDCLKSVTKWSEKIPSPSQTPRFINFAMRKAISGKPGPVGLIIPEDVMMGEELWIKHFIPEFGGACSIEGCSIKPTDHEIDNAVNMILDSEQPLIFVGSQAINFGAFSEVKELSELLQVPVFSTITGKGIMEDNGKNTYFGTIGLFGEKPLNRFTRRSDLIIAIGNRLTEDDTAMFKYPPTHKKMIQIDIDPGEIGLSYQATGIIGDCKAALQMIIKELSKHKDKFKEIENRKINLDKLRKQLNKHREKDSKNWINAEPIKPQRILFKLSEIMNEKDFLVTDASASSRWIGAYYKMKGIGRRIITPRGVGPTGFGLGGVLGTGIALQEIHGDNIPNLVLLTGDGGLMNAGVSDLETLVKYGINCTIIILNNSTLGFVKFGQAILFQRRIYDTDRPTSNFVKIAQALGCKGFKIISLEELDSKLETIIKEDGVKVVDIITDPEELLPPNFY